MLRLGLSLSLGVMPAAARPVLTPDNTVGQPIGLLLILTKAS